MSVPKRKKLVKKPNGSSVNGTSMPALDPLIQALRVKLMEIVETPLTARSLFELERAARLGREILLLGSGPAAVRQSGPLSTGLYDVATPYGGFGIGGYSMYSNGLNLVGSDPPSPSESIVGGVSTPSNTLAPSSKPENFGAVILRELLALKGAASDHAPSPAETVTAIALARDKGLTDIAEKLETSLFGVKA